MLFADLNFKLPSNYFLASFDIVSLFTNIPVDETIDIIVDLAFTDNTLFHNFNRSQFKLALTLASKDIDFLFNKKITNKLTEWRWAAQLAQL